MLNKMEIEILDIAGGLRALEVLFQNLDIAATKDLVAFDVVFKYVRKSFDSLEQLFEEFICDTSPLLKS